MTSPRRLSWFSCGAASAVASKLAVERHGVACEVVYCDTFASEHPDNRRFFDDVQRWIGAPIRVIRSAKYATVDDVFERTRFMAGIAGARCTVEMKKIPRLEYQEPNDTHVFGFTADERKRADEFEARNPELHVDRILIDEWVTKAECLRRIAQAGIALPAMYALGFDHNNCVGCVKATSPGYWNRTRREFPDIFDRRARQARSLGVKLARVDGRRVYLDEIPLDADAPDDAIECGPACQAPQLELTLPTVSR